MAVLCGCFDLREEVLPTLAPVPTDAQGYVVMPRWSAIADSPQGALHRVCQLLAGNDSDEQYLRGITCESHSTKTARAWAQLEGGGTSTNFLVFPCTWEAFHGQSEIQASSNLLPQQFFLDAFAAGSILLGNPQLLGSDEDPYAHCLAEEYTILTFSRRRLDLSPFWRKKGNGKVCGLADRDSVGGDYVIPIGWLS